VHHEVVCLDELATRCGANATRTNPPVFHTVFWDGFLCHNSGFVARFAHQSDGRRIVVSNYQLCGDPSLEFVRLCQAHSLCQYIFKVVEGDGTNGIPILFCGDLQFLPDGAVHQYLVRGAAWYDWTSQLAVWAQL